MDVFTSGRNLNQFSTILEMKIISNLFRPASDEDIDFVLFENNTSKPPICSSHVGRQGGMQTIQLGSIQCFKKEVITHEMIHAIGFYHEHTRMDRDNYVQVDYGCVRDNLEKNFKIQPNSESFGIPYDPLSIMHYRPTQGSTDPDCKTLTSKVNLIQL